MNPGAPVLASYRTLGLGDLLTAVPALRGARAAFPEHRHVLATSGWLAPLVGLIDAVDGMVALDELQPLPPDDVDVAVNLHGRGPQSHIACLAARPRRLVAFHHPEVPGTEQGPRWRDDEHEVVRWCRLLEESGIAAYPHDLLVDVDASANGGQTIVHPGAKAGARRWPSERFAAVAAELGRHGRDVVVTGSPHERGLAEVVAEGAGLPPEAVLAGRTDLRDLVTVVAGAQLVVCGDTGVAHLATALATPSVVLFGPTSPERWGPPAHLRHRHRVLWAGRSGDPLAVEPDPGLLEIEVDDVLREVAMLSVAAPDASGADAFSSTCLDSRA